MIIFDRLFGTYIPGRDQVDISYGWVEPITTRNVFKLQATPWTGLFKDLASARSLREAAGLLCMPPGWRADGLGNTTENLRHGAVQLAAAPAIAVATAATDR